VGREREEKMKVERGGGGLTPRSTLGISPADVERWRPALLLITASTALFWV